MATADMAWLELSEMSLYAARADIGSGPILKQLEPEQREE
jgi:hypothetical protein